MTSLNPLSDIFARYAGKEIKHSVMDSLAEEVRQVCYVFGGAQEKGAPQPDDTGPTCLPRLRVVAEYESGTDGKTRLTGNYDLWP